MIDRQFTLLRDDDGTTIQYRVLFIDGRILCETSELVIGNNGISIGVRHNEYNMSIKVAAKQFNIPEDEVIILRLMGYK